jgi:hypothetical protein
MNPYELFSTYMGDSTKNYPLKSHSTYTRVSNFGHILGSKMALRLICGSTYTRVYTVPTVPIQGVLLMLTQHYHVVNHTSHDSS